MWGKARLGADEKIAVLLVGLVAITRIPFRLTVLYNWDSANFALAMQHFDVTRHHPHPPGYFFYVSLARLIDAILHDANASLVAESVLFSALAVVALYYLGKTMFDRTTGLLAALLLVFSVTFWSYGLLALPYVALAFFSTVVAFLAYRIIFEQRNLHLPLALAYVIGGGFRPDLMLFLAPLWLFSLRGQRLSRVVATVVAAVGTFLAWFLPTTLLSGGLEQYVATFVAYTSTDVLQRYSVPQNGLAALFVNIRDTSSYLFFGLYATAAALAIGLVIGLVRLVLGTEVDRDRLRQDVWSGGKGLFIAGWLAPMALFYVWIHVGDPGYVFTMLPALLILAAKAIEAIAFALARLRGRNMSGEVVAAITAGILLANALVFFLHPRPLTLQGIRQTNRGIASKIDYIRERYAPGAVLLISYDLYRHLEYYLPQYDSLWLDVYGKGTGEKRLRAGVKQIILLDERLSSLAVGAREIPLDGGKLYSTSATPGERVIYSKDRIAVD